MRPEYLKRIFVFNENGETYPAWLNTDKSRRCAYVTVTVFEHDIPSGYRKKIGFFEADSMKEEKYLFDWNGEAERLLDTALLETPLDGDSRKDIEYFEELAFASFRMAVNLGKELDG